MSMNFDKMVITPEMATEILKGQIRNRKVNQNRVKMYATQMENGEWGLSPQPICFNEDGELSDGQHRLLAVIKSNIPIEFIVAKGVPNDAVIDQGLARNSSDALYMRGLINKSSSVAMSVVNRYLTSSYGCNNYNDKDRMKFINRYEKEIDEAIKISKRGDNSPILRKAPVQAAILGALICGVDEKALDRFAKVANTGYAESSEETAAITLVKYMRSLSSFSGEKVSSNLCMFAEMAIKDFVNKVPRKKVYKDLFHVYIQVKSKDNI